MKRSILMFFVIGVTLILLGCSENNPTSPELSQGDQETTTLSKTKATFTGTCTFVAPDNPGVQFPLPNGNILSEGETVYWYDLADEALVSGISKWYISRIIREDGTAKLWGKAEIFVGTDTETENPQINNDGIWEISWHGWLTSTPEIVCDAAGTGKSGDVQGMVANWVYTFNFSLGRYDTEGYILK